MRLPISLLAAAACGSSTPPATPSNRGVAETPAAPGTSGLAGLDWGASEDVVRAASPTVTSRQGGGLAATGQVDGIRSITSFQFGAHGLAQIDIEWTDSFASMADCSTRWTALRAKYDGRFGASQTDNLAAYWKTATASIVLACNPNENGAGVLSMMYAPLVDN